MFRFFRRRPSLREALAAMPSPLHRLLQTLLKSSRIGSASVTAIVFGMPRDLPRDVLDAAIADWRRMDADSEARHPVTGPEGMDLEATGRAMRGGAELRCANGLRQLPTWQRVEGRLYPTLGVPIGCFPVLLNMIDEHLVSLDATEADPKPRRFFEYEDDSDPLHRWFAEVELWLDDDNTIRLEILGHRRERLSVRAVQSVY